MIIFFQIVLGAPVLSLAAWGLGRRMGLKELPAAAILAGWTALLVLAAATWLARLPAIYAAPVFVGLVGWGVATAVAQIPRKELAWGALGGVVMGGLFALPFALQPRLLAYAHWGTDQWGYAGVSKWLMLHAVNELPVFEHKPGLAWVWTVLVTRDRPLIYELQAMLSASFGLEPSVAYYVLPAALQGSLFLALFSSGTLTGIASTAGRSAVAFALAAQPSVWLHFQHQFFGGALAALFLLILAAGLLEQHVQRRRDASVFAGGALLAVLIGSLYTVNLSYAALGLVGLLWLSAVMVTGRVEWAGIRWRAAWRPIALLTLALACWIGSRFATREAALEVRGDGSSHQTLAQIGAFFGETKITPWYQRAGSLGALDVSPTNYAPNGSVIGIVCAIAAAVLGCVLSWRWWRRGLGFGLTTVLALVAVAIAMAVPPRGDHVLLSRCLPVFGPLWLLALCVGAAGETVRPLRWLAIGLVCWPLLRAAPGMARMLHTPVNAISEGQWSAPPDGDSWSCAAYVYFYQDLRDIDWTKAPQTYREMTHYLPPSMKPSLTRPK